MSNKAKPPARILVVDDEPGLADLIATALRYAGFETTTAFRGYEAYFGLVVFNIF